MKRLWLVLVLIIIIKCQVLNCLPVINGRFFGDGDNNEYILLTESAGEGSLYYYLSEDDLYLAVVVSTTINDNVFAKNGQNRTYLESVGWPRGKHNASSLIVDTSEDNCHLEMTLSNGSETWNWKQCLLTASGNNWVSNIYEGSAPVNIESTSSTSWNINSSAWNYIVDKNQIKWWKSPYDGDSVPGYPFFDNSTEWEWPLVYEMKIPLTSLGASSFSLEINSVYNEFNKNETADFIIPTINYLDYGDAPESYGTLNSSVGAAHHILTDAICLGVTVDAEFSGQPSADCDGDDFLDGSDDEDGVEFINNWEPGETGSLALTASGSGNLSAWADFNQDGDWEDPGEQIFADQLLVNGLNNLSVSIPTTVNSGILNVRFRFSSDSGLLSYGIASDGEVEDYQITVIEDPASLGNYVWHDFTQDGIQDPYEYGVAGFTVNLYNYNNGNPILEATTTSAGDGSYLFTNIDAGQYFVEFEKGDWDFTINDFLDNDDVDSDANPLDGRTEVYSLAAGEENISVDCGLYESNPLPVTLSDFIAEFHNGSSKLEWTTQSESNNSGWNIYRAFSANPGQSIKINCQPIQGAGTTSEPTDYIFYDQELYNIIQTEDLLNPVVYYWLESVDNSGGTGIYGPISIMANNSGNEYSTPEIPDVYGLNQNYPNPFNPETSISFILAEDEKATLHIYNVKGECVKTLFKAKECTGRCRYIERWNGKDKQGRNVSSGIYLAVLKTDKELFTRKMILQK